MSLMKLLSVFLVCLSVATAQTDTLIVQGGDNCFEPEQFCFGDSGANAIFEPVYDSDIESTPHACLASTPNAGWFYIEIETADPSGQLAFDISMVDQNGVGVDVDFAAWGPYNNLQDAIRDCDNFPGSGSISLLAQSSDTCDGNTCDACSWSLDSEEQALITVGSGQVVMLLVTNFANVQNGEITLSQSTTDATADCSCNNDGLCKGVETFSDCPNDCWNLDNFDNNGYCGDGSCIGAENNVNCPRDCNDVIRYWGFSLDNVDGTSNAVEVWIQGDNYDSGWQNLATGGTPSDAVTNYVIAIEEVFIGVSGSITFRVGSSSASSSWVYNSIVASSSSGYAWFLSGGTIFASTEREYTVVAPTAYSWDFTIDTGSQFVNGVERAGTTAAIFMEIFGTTGETGWVLVSGTGLAASSSYYYKFYLDWDIGQLISFFFYVNGMSDGWWFTGIQFGGEAYYTVQALSWWGYHEEFGMAWSQWTFEYVFFAISCGPLVVDNAQVTSNSDTYGGTATINCNTDYGISGSSTCECAKDGFWFGCGSCVSQPSQSATTTPTPKPPEPSASITRTPSSKPSVTPSNTPTNTPTRTPSRTSSRTASRTPSRTASITPSRTASRTATSTPSPTASISMSPSSSTVTTCEPTPEPGCECEERCGPLTRLNVNFDGMFRGINF